MKPKHIFWGLLFITIGILILLNNIGSLTIDLDNYWRYWPLFLILLGASFLLSNKWLKSLLAAFAGVILAFALFSFFSFTFAFVGNRFVINDNGVHFDMDNDNGDTTYYSEPYDSSIRNAEFDFNAGAGRFKMSDTTSKLFEAFTQGYYNNYDLNTYVSAGKTIVKFKMLKKKFIFNDNDNGNKAFIKLNTRPVWDMNLKLGAASTDFDLSPYLIKNIRLESGAAKIKIKLGDRNDVTNFKVEAGVTSLTIDVPKSAGCQINEDVSLSSKNFEGFDKTGSGTYRTGNFNSAKKKIFIRLKSGVSSLRVYRYSSGWEIQ